MIKVSNVSHQIAGCPILTDVSVDIPGQGITALIGPNGAGKSTLLSLIARLEPLQTGSIHVDTLRVGQCSDRELAQHLSVLPQTAEQPPRLTVRELIGFGRYPYHRGRPTPEDHIQVDRALSVLGMSDLANRQLDSLSGGQRQRAQIAMIFAQDTDYVLLDEPLNNLDLAGTRTLLNILRTMSDDFGKTILIVIHDINIAAGHADRIVALKAGRIVAQGTPDSIINADLVKNVFDTETRIIEAEGRKLVLT